MTQQKNQTNHSQTTTSSNHGASHSNKNQQNSRDDHEIRYQDQDKNQYNNKEDYRSDKSSDTSNRGFATMDSEKQREIASNGGKAAHEKGTAHEFNSEEAREYGQKSGKASHSQDNKDTQEPHNRNTQSR